MTDEVTQRRQSARQRIEAARLLMDEAYLPDAISRMYYGVFEAARALLLSEDINPGTHAGVINQLGFRFRDTLDVVTVTQLRQDREGCDYELSRPPLDHVQNRLAQAQDFVDRVSDLIDASHSSS